MLNNTVLNSSYLLKK